MLNVHKQWRCPCFLWFRPILLNNIALDNYLYNNTCSFCIFIGRELCVIKVHTHGWRQLMAWSNLANLFRGSSHDFCQLYYNIKQIDFIFLCFCTVIDHRWRHSVWRTKSHALDILIFYFLCKQNKFPLLHALIYLICNYLYLLGDCLSEKALFWIVRKAFHAILTIYSSSNAL